MDTPPLVIDEIEAGKEFLGRLNAYKTVKAACWLRGDENEERYLYAALEGLTVQNSDVAYGEVMRITQEMKDHYVDPFRVKLISEEHRVARALAEIYQRYGNRVPTRISGRVFAGMAVEEIYIYPPLTSNA